jgi:hypothetical protein
MTGIPESRWLYTRGAQSVRLLREETPDGCRVFLHGPATDVTTHDFANIADCMKWQAQIELGLLASGYQLARSSSDRRREHR